MFFPSRVEDVFQPGRQVAFFPAGLKTVSSPLSLKVCYVPNGVVCGWFVSQQSGLKYRDPQQVLSAFPQQSCVCFPRLRWVVFLAEVCIDGFPPAKSPSGSGSVKIIPSRDKHCLLPLAG